MIRYVNYPFNESNSNRNFNSNNSISNSFDIFDKILKFNQLNENERNKSKKDWAWRRH
jgi:hypothetical protein